VTDKNSKYYGKPFTTRRKYMGGLCKRAGIKLFGFHALRRFVASYLADTANISSKGIQKFLLQKFLRIKELYTLKIENALREIVNL
jgi:integrase